MAKIFQRWDSYQYIQNVFINDSKSWLKLLKHKSKLFYFMRTILIFSSWKCLLKEYPKSVTFSLPSIPILALDLTTKKKFEGNSPLSSDWECDIKTFKWRDLTSFYFWSFLNSIFYGPLFWGIGRTWYVRAILVLTSEQQAIQPIFETFLANFII